MSLIAFFIGLFILFKGSFHLGSRTVTFGQSRSIAIMLMAPLVLEFCASFVIVMNNPNIIQWGADGTPSINSDAFNYIADTIGTLELISVGIAVLLAIFTIYGAPKSDSSTVTFPQQRSLSTPPPTPAQVPNIMTVAQAAAYMHLTESDVMNLIDQGKLGAARMGNTYRIARIAIEDFLGQA